MTVKLPVISAEPVKGNPLPAVEADPDTICPPLATTTLPVAPPKSLKVISTVSLVVVFIVAGNINSSLLLYTETTTFLVSKLWVTSFEEAFVNVSDTVATSATVALTLVNAEQRRGNGVLGI